MSDPRSDPRGIPFASIGKRFMKYAEKKLQQHISSLDTQTSVANSASEYPNPNPYNQTYADYYSAPNPPYNPPYDPSPSPSPSPAQQNYNPPVFNAAPPPPAPFTEPFPQPPQDNASTAPTPHPPPPNSAPTPLNASGPVITQDLLLQMQARVPSACKSLGTPAVTEARKGLSRVLSPTPQDINSFATQLKNSDVKAVEPNWNTIDDDLPCFAISYVQHPPQGRYKFSDEQWNNFHAIVQAMAAAGVTQFRVWLDQCLWLRDASQASWAHTGIVPYVLWPVIALGAKAPGAERTKDSFYRMWPFVEQIAGLWGMGLIIASEYRNQNMVDGDLRSWLSYNLRARAEPESDLFIILLNIFHGAIDGLKTGWVDDVRELREMANANVMYANEQVIIGSDWKNRFASIPPLGNYSAVDNIRMSIRSKYLGGVDIYLDGSRSLECKNWQGIREWLSGNEGPTPSTQHDITMLNIGMGKYNLITEDAEYQLLQRGSVTNTLWLLVAMQGRSSNFSRGRVAWTKVLAGPGSCRIGEMMENGDIKGIQRVLCEELKKPNLRIRSATMVNAEIEWM